MPSITCKFRCFSWIARPRATIYPQNWTLSAGTSTSDGTSSRLLLSENYKSGEKKEEEEDAPSWKNMESAHIEDSLPQKCMDQYCVGSSITLPPPPPQKKKMCTKTTCKNILFMLTCFNLHTGEQWRRRQILQSNKPTKANCRMDSVHVSW